MKTLLSSFVTWFSRKLRFRKYSIFLYKVCIFLLTEKTQNIQAASLVNLVEEPKGRVTLRFFLPVLCYIIDFGEKTFAEKRVMNKSYLFIPMYSTI